MEEEDFGGYAFANLSTHVQGFAQGSETRKLTTVTGHLTMSVDSGASWHYFDDKLHPGLKDTLLELQGARETLQESHRRTTRSTRNSHG